MASYDEGQVQSYDGTEIHYAVLSPCTTKGAKKAAKSKEHRYPDVVLCDGLGCDGFIWKYLAPALAKRHRVIRWHYRGHGRSAAPSSLDRLSVPDLVEDLVAVLDACECKKVVLCGHSVGVQVILEAMRRHSDRVLALVPICGAYGNPLDTFHDTVTLKRLFPIIHRAFEGVPDLVLRLWRTLLPSRAAYFVARMAGEVNRSLIRIDDLQPYFDHLGAMDPRVFVSMLSQVAEHSARDLLPSIEVPTLVVGAEQDTFTPVWLSEEMSDMIQDSELLIIPRGSHVAPIEQPELLELRLEKFFRERLPK